MGWNLGDVFAGIAQGVGSGMTMNAKNEIDTQNQMNMETRRAELDAKRTEAMARLNRELTEPDRKQTQANNERDYGLRDRQQSSVEAYQKGILDDKSVQRTLTDQKNQAIAERDAAKLAGMGGAGGAGNKPLKLDQTLSDADKSYEANFYKQLEKAQDPLAGGKPEEIAAKTAQLEKQRFARFGMKTEIDEGGGVTITDRTGYTKRFNSPEEAAQSGFKTKVVADAMEAKVALARDAGPPRNLANPQDLAEAEASKRKPGGKGVSLADLANYTPDPASPAGQHAARAAQAREQSQAKERGDMVGKQAVRDMVQQNAATYSPEQAMQILDAYGSMLASNELILLQNRIKGAR